MGVDTCNHLGCQNLNLKLKWQQKYNNEKIHTLNEHTWGHKTLWGSPTLAKKHWLLQKEGKKFKGFELPPHLSLKKLLTIFHLARLQKLRSS